MRISDWRSDVCSSDLMAPRTDFLTDEERQVVNLLIEASDLMNRNYLRQVAVDNPETRAAIDAAKGGDHELLLDLFDLNFGPWNRYDEITPFWSDRACPKSSAFYPADHIGRAACRGSV